MTTNLSYWHWLVAGTGDKPGYRRFLNLFLLVHAVIGGALAYLIKADLPTVANTVLVPLAGVFIGLCFAWASNAQALMQSKEIGQLAKYRKGGLVEYVFVYQTAILAVFATMVFWGLAGLQVFQPLSSFTEGDLAVKAVLFVLSSIALRECWQVVLGTQWMLLSQKNIEEHNESQERQRNGKKK
jgi:hypothetical protein